MRRSKTWKLSLNVNTFGVIPDSYCLINTRKPEVLDFSEENITLPDEVKERIALLVLQRPGPSSPTNIGHLASDRLIIVYLTNAEGRMIKRMLENYNDARSKS